MILARELARQPRFLIAAQPTRGVDIGAMEYIHNQLLLQRSEGLATLLISEDLDEVRALSDRVVVMFGGQVMGIVNNADTTPGTIGVNDGRRGTDATALNPGRSGKKVSCVVKIGDIYHYSFAGFLVILNRGATYSWESTLSQLLWVMQNCILTNSESH
jgi:energy-coupling factor transporter ATP-binding protein EcfA2